jgi:hypothetical protein
VLGWLWLMRREPLYLMVAVAVLVWGLLWVWGAAREQRGRARAAAAPPYHPPRPGEVVILGRARLRRLGHGVLLAGEDALLWVAGDLPTLGRIGQALPLGALAAAGDDPQVIVTWDDLESYVLRAGVVAADTLTLRLHGGGEVALRPLDPEVGTLLLAAVAGADEPPAGEA